ncbi:MAG: hypothetical protein ACO2ZD_08825, partial [Pseudomonadales bacterium]
PGLEPKKTFCCQQEWTASFDNNDGSARVKTLQAMFSLLASKANEQTMPIGYRSIAPIQMSQRATKTVATPAI